VVDLVVLVEAALGVPGVLPAMDFQALVVRRYWILAIDIAIVVVIDPV
jgi:predicted cobalt transporter CbtA